MVEESADCRAAELIWATANGGADRAVAAAIVAFIATFSLSKLELSSELENRTRQS